MKPSRAKYLNWVVAESRRKLKLKAIEYKGGQCTQCGYSKCVASLQFHHLDPTKKDFQIGGTLRSWLKLKVELDKTILLCANCHGEHHYKDVIQNSLKQETEVRLVTPARVPSKCGTVAHYIKGCRCSLCREANAKRHRDYVLKCKGKSQTVEYSGCKVVGEREKDLHTSVRYVDWPSDEELKALIWVKPATSVAKEIGVSSVAIKKRCKLRGIETPPRGYWSKVLHKSASRPTNLNVVTPT